MDKKKEEEQDKKVSDAVDAWFMETFHNLGLDTPLFNRFYAAKDTLKKRIQTALRKKEE